MRRISLALALLGAVAAAGCGGAGGKSPAPSSGNKGVEQASFKLVVRGEGSFLDADGVSSIILPKGGVVSGGGIDCGVDGTGALHKVCELTLPYNTGVSLTATGNLIVGSSPAAYNIHGWAGACTGTGGCSFTMTDTQFVGVRFAADSGSLGAHGPFAAHEIHGAEYLKLQQGVAGAYNCSAAACHGATLQGVALAPACTTCHAWPIGPHMAVTNSSHNSGACARCHVGSGFRDYIGADGTADNHLAGYTGTGTALQNAGKLDNTTFGKDMQCDMCHNDVLFNANNTMKGTLNTIQFAQASGAGKTVTVNATTALCGQCHTSVRDGRNIATVAAAIGTPTDWDAVLAAPPAGGVRPHYLGAASTFLGADAAVYGQIAGAVYSARNPHGNLAACTSCHSPHTGSLPADSNPNDPANTIAAKCGGCHNDELTGLPVTTFAQLEESRQYGFEGDIDGDGVQESLKVEIEGMKAKLVAALRAYSVALGQPDMCFVVDATTGLADQAYVLDTPAQPCNAIAADKVTKLGNNTTYTKFTARSLRAAFNYMAIQNDLGAWAHNPRYAIEILYDSIADLNLGIVTKITTSPPVVPNGLRAFNGHFGAADAASKYSAMLYHGGANAVTGELIPPMGGWSAACGQCHGGSAGLSSYLAGMPAALTVATPAVPAMQCDTCHVLTGTDMKTLRSITKVYFPPQKNGAPTAGEVSFNGADLPVTFALCGSCHSARENKKTVDNKGLSSGAFTATLVNPHYLGAAATVMGTRTKSWYEYDGKSYTAFPAFWKSGTNGRAPGPHGSPHGAECTGCHQGKASKHSFEVDYTYCAGCHTGNYALAPKEEEYASMKAELLAALNAYVTSAANNAAFTTANANATGLCYDGNVYGYVLVQTASGCTTTGAKLDLNAMKAAYNLHWMNKDPGGWAHNEYYVMQLVYDSIVDLGGTPTFRVAAVTSGYPVAVPVAGDPLNRGY
jgi:hypothetical protein